VLDQSGWVTPEQAEAARAFQQFLLSDEMQAEAGNFYLRPLDRSTPLGTALSLANGTDPEASPATVPPLGIPSPEVSESIIDQFLATKRKATMILVLDVSGSMQGEPIKTATEATADFLSRLDPRDRVGVVIFRDRAGLLSGVEPVSSRAETMRSQVLGLAAGGGTALYDAICTATEMLEAERRKDATAGENRLYGVVLLSDGQDTASEISETRMFQTCLGKDEGQDGTRVFAIGFGEGSDMAVLNRLADETNGAVFTADPRSIGATYLKISAEQ
jgi:Ca-activated chloride channel family protein